MKTKINNAIDVFNKCEKRAARTEKSQHQFEAFIAYENLCDVLSNAGYNINDIMYKTEWVQCPSCPVPVHVYEHL